MAVSIANLIEQKLTAALSPTSLSIIDESHRHAGHAGAHPEGESHFRVVIVSPRFEGLGRIERQRLVNRALAAELAERVHALAMRTLTPGEARNDPTL